ncbi:MAG: bifunctional metallophosphatase/5'-nucleotidase [Sporolactobacillus sp.]|nr:bifunctional metallophosphatase/5'-nucleotidase [Sporolactobacillus sp.]
MISLHFLHTNDLHSHFDRWGMLVDYLNRERIRLREMGEPQLTLDLGDQMDRFHPMTEGLLGAGNVTLLNEAGYDYVTIGNNEGITFTKQRLSAMYKHSRFSVILANLYEKDGRRPSWCSPYTIVTMKGVRVGLIGLTAAFPKYYRVLGWDIRDPFAELKQDLQQLMGRTDLVVLMSHVGLPFDKRVAEEMAGIDVIIGAHTHHALERGLTVDGTLIAQAGKYGRYCGHVVVDYDEQARRIVHKGADLITLRGEADDSADREVRRLTAAAVANMQQVVVSLRRPLIVDWYHDSPLPQVLADALREWCRADIGMVNAGVILGDLPAGPVTRYAIHHICPHPINPCKVNVTGAELLEMIAIGLKKSFQTYELKGFGFRGKRLGKLMFSHLSYRVDQAETARIADVRINGEPLRPERTYSLGTIDVFTMGTFLPPVVRAEQTFFLPETLRDLLAWRLQTIKPFT